MVWHLPCLCQMLSPGCRPYLGLLAWLGRRLAFSPRSFLSLVVFWKPAACWRHPSIPVFFIAVCIQPAGRATNRDLSVPLYCRFWRICVLSCTISHWGRNSFERITSLSYLSKSKHAPVLVIMDGLEELWDFFANPFHVHKSYCNLSAREEKSTMRVEPSGFDWSYAYLHTCRLGASMKSTKRAWSMELKKLFCPPMGHPMGHPEPPWAINAPPHPCAYPDQ